MSPDAIRDRIRAALPDADVSLTDLTGTADHWQARIVSAQFTGVSPIERHRMINRALAAELTGPIHALTMELLTPDEASEPVRNG